MIIVKLGGGLGNQMFQYAAAKALADKHQQTLKLDISHFNLFLPKETPRIYRLNIFNNIQEEIASKQEIEDIVTKFSSGIIARLYKAFHKHLFYLNKSYNVEKSLLFKEINLPSGRNVYIDGYWQSELYFKPASEIIRRCFDLHSLPKIQENKEVLEQISVGFSVSIHVRRGDYMANPSVIAYHGVPDAAYYKRAISRIVSSSLQQPSFFIFSDDIEWCKQNLKLSYKHTFVSSSEEYIDLYLMSSCKHNIIANSSFSWWAAWLNSNPEKMVIAPKKWFAANVPNDIVPKDWITE